MNIIVVCPSCSSRLAVKQSGSRVIICPKCKFEILADEKLQPGGSADAFVSLPANDTISPRTPDPPLQEFDLSLLSTPHSLLGSIRAPLSRKTNSDPAGTSPENEAPVYTGPLSTAPPSGANAQLRSTYQAVGLPSSETTASYDPEIPLAVPLRFIPGQIQTSETFSATSSEILATSSSEPDLSQEGLARGIAGSVHISILKRKKRQRLFFFVTNSILAVLTLGFTGALYWQLNQNESHLIASERPRDKSVAAPANGPKISPKTESVAPKAEQLASPPAAEPDPPAPPLPPKFLFFSPKQVADIWKTTKPNLVSLKIDSPNRRQNGVGLIVDSRGWIVTSHQAVKDATRIEVTSATEPLNQTDQYLNPPLVDLVRGHVIDDPTQDLAILAVNRRFVVSLAEPTFAEKDRLVEQVRLLAAAPPSNSNYFGVGEVHVERRCSLDHLPLATKSRMELLKIGKPELTWNVLHGETEFLPGTPLLDKNGTVQAMVSLSTEKNRALAVSLASLKSLLAKTNGEVRPLKLNMSQTGDSKSVLIDGDHPAHQALVPLIASANSCRDFAWIPESDEHYEMLMEFCRQYVTARALVMSYDQDYRDAADIAAAYAHLEEEMKQLAEEVRIRIQSAIDEDHSQLEALNAFAESRLQDKRKSIVPVFVRVVEDGLQLKQFIVQLEGKDTCCAVPFDPVARPLRPGSCWLLVLETTNSNTPSKIKLGNGRTVDAYSALQRTEIGPLRAE